MIDRRFLAEAAAIVGAAVLCAAISNFVAGRERKLVPVGSYPNAMKVPPKATDTAPAPPATASPGAPAPAGSSAASAAPIPAGATVAVAPKGGSPKTASSPPVSATAKPVAPAKAFPPHPDKPWLEIGYDDVALLHQRKALFLDARRTSVYEEGHIAGARSFAVWEADVDAKVKALLDEGIDSAAPIVVYCTGGHCEDSHMLSDKLYQVGFNNALVYKDGFPDWQKQGGAVETGAPR